MEDLRKRGQVLRTLARRDSNASVKFRQVAKAIAYEHSSDLLEDALQLDAELSEESDKIIVEMTAKQALLLKELLYTRISNRLDGEIGISSQLPGLPSTHRRLTVYADIPDLKDDSYV